MLVFLWVYFAITAIWYYYKLIHWCDSLHDGEDLIIFVPEYGKSMFLFALLVFPLVWLVIGYVITRHVVIPWFNNIKKQRQLKKEAWASFMKQYEAQKEMGQCD